MAKKRSTKEMLPLQFPRFGDRKNANHLGLRKSKKAERQEMFLPVSGFVWFYPEEMEVINHPAFQRLGRINQLGLAYLVFRGATHRRIEHALGAVHVIGRMITAVVRNAEKHEANGRKLGTPLSEDEERFVRLGALLHDIGHLAAGHTLEDELGLLPQHDKDDRLDLVFGKTDFDPNYSESLGALIDRMYSIYVPSVLKGKVSPTQIVRLIIRKEPTTSDPYKDVFALLKNSPALRLNVCANMVGNTVCADLLDYLFRDWYHVGKPRTFDDRILQYMEIRATSDSIGGEPDPSDRFVVALGKGPKIRTDGVSAILELLEWRYQLAETVLFHKTKLAAAAMLDRALLELWEKESDTKELIGTVLMMSDDQLIDDCIYVAEDRASKATGRDQQRLLIASSNLNAIKNRRLFTELKTWVMDDLGRGLRDRVRDLYGVAGNTKEAAINRTQALRGLELDFQLNPGSLAMYYAEIKPKIAEVSIAVGDTIEKFNEYEKDEKTLSGGHLDAQIKRFDKLRRVYVFVERSEKQRLEERGLLQTLIDTIDALVLGHCEDFATRARDIAHALAGLEGSPWRGSQVLEAAVEAARSDATSAELSGYPGGVPCIRAFFAPKARIDAEAV